jgi:hypothetical protein
MTDNTICEVCGNWIPEGHECRDIEEALIGDGVTTTGCKFDFGPTIIVTPLDIDALLARFADE